MLTDLKHALRRIAQSPGFALVAVLILALGIGTNAAIFTFFDVCLLRALPVRDPGRLVLFTTVRSTRGGSEVNDRLSYPTFERLREQSRTLSDAFATFRVTRVLVPPGAASTAALQAVTCHVTGNYFSDLGIAPARGRILGPSDDLASRPQAVAVVSYAFWRQQLAGAPDVVGRTVLIDRVPFAIVGVAAEGFGGTELARQIDVWTPVQSLALFDPAAAQQLQQPRYTSFLVFGRLAPGRRRAEAEAEANVIYQAQGAELGVPAPQQAQNWGRVALVPGGAGWVDNRSNVEEIFAIVLSMVGLVLVLVCANVASLMLARVAARQRELAVRAALGAGRLRLIRQLMVEGLVLAAAGGALGLLVLQWCINWLGRLLDVHASHFDLRPDPTVLLFILGISLFAGIFIGLIPALRFSQINLIGALKNQAGTVAAGGRQRLNQGLVLAQIAICVCLLAGAGLFARSLGDLRNVDLGFPAGGLLQVTVGLDNYGAAQQADLARTLLRGLAALPGVERASLSEGGALDHSQWTSASKVEGYVPRSGEDMRVFFSQVGPDFFETERIPLLRGRGLGFADVFPVTGPGGSKARAVVVNEAWARRFFGTGDPIGRHVSLFAYDQAEIVGVAKTVKYAGPRDPGTPQVFVPYGFGPTNAKRLEFVVRAAGSPEALTSAVSALVRQVDPAAQVLNFSTMEAQMSQHYLSQDLVMAQVSGYFGLVALALACLGLYGLLAYSVAQRTREIGVRMALGADVREIVSLVLGQALRLAVPGCLAGIAAAALLVKLIASRLYGVSPADPPTYLGTAVLLLGVVLLACWLPARRACAVDPMVALRAE